jgi:hypothetical protein
MTYTNAKGKTYYLHWGTTKTGKPKYHFSMQSEGTLAESIPAGFEIYENPNAQVFLRRIPPKIITDEERQVVEDGMRKYADVQDYKIDVKGNAIVVYTADQDLATLAAIVRDPHASSEENARRMQLLRESIHYSDLLRFMLIDAKRRTFVTQRYCFIGSIDDWIDIERSGTLAHLVTQHVKHFGKESYFNLWETASRGGHRERAQVRRRRGYGERTKAALDDHDRRNAPACQTVL